MRIDERVSLSANVLASQIAVTTVEGRLITIRANDIVAVEELIPDVRSAIYTGVRSRIYWNDVAVTVRLSAAAVLALIDATLPTLPATEVYVRDEKAQNTDSGTFTSGAFQTRDLNVIQSDLGSLASLAANQLTLLSGTYICNIQCPAYQVQRHQTRLQNITDGVTTLVGTSTRANPGDIQSNKSFIIGLFQIAASKVFEVQHQCSATRANDGFGERANFTTEVYTVAKFRRTGE